MAGFLLEEGCGPAQADGGRVLGRSQAATGEARSGAACSDAFCLWDVPELHKPLLAKT